LLEAVDKTKDQSYFLAGCSTRSFRNVLFPLGDYTKRSVRELAKHWNLPTAEKRDSTGICFVGKRPFRQFVHEYLPPATNPIQFVDIDTGVVVGTSETPSHAYCYTVGQGAKIGGVEKKYFCVKRIQNTIFVCAGTHHPALYTDTFQLDMKWTLEVPPPRLLTEPLRVQCRIRHLQPKIEATLYSTAGQAWVELDKPLRGVTPGQFAVFYCSQVCLGGGTITASGPSYLELGKELTTLHPAGHNDKSAVEALEL
jgi:tRNA-specific 2-thiouridylase